MAERTSRSDGPEAERSERARRASARMARVIPPPQIIVRSAHESRNQYNNRVLTVPGIAARCSRNESAWAFGADTSITT